MKGGYKIIDFKNQNLTTTTTTTIVGTYNAINNNYGKALLFENLVIGGNKLPSVYVQREISGTNYLFKNVYGYTIQVSNKDVISIETSEDGE